MKFFQKTNKVFAFVLALLMILSSVTAVSFAEETVTPCEHTNLTTNYYQLDSNNHYVQCDDCKALVTAEHDYQLDEEASVAATCEADGANVYVCSQCGQTKTETVEKTNHKDSIVTIVGTAATCTDDGLTEGEFCTACKKIVTAQTKIPAFGCPEEQWIKIPGEKATCTEDGLTDGYKCGLCDEIKVEQEVITAKGHTNGHYVEYQAPTCSKEGYVNAWVCDVCGVYEYDGLNDTNEDGVVDVKDGILAKTSHALVAQAGKDATCDEDGYTAYNKCQHCEYTEGKEIIPMLEHDMVEDEEARVDATCTADGTKTYKCQNEGCTHTETETIPAGHTWSVDAEYRYLSVLAETYCGELLAPHTCEGCGAKELRLIEVQGEHDYDVEIVTEPTCHSKGAAIYTCKNCEHTYEAELPMVDHAWETANGYTALLGKVCGYVVLPQACGYEDCDATRNYYAVGTKEHNLTEDENGEFDCDGCGRHFKTQDDADKSATESAMPLQFAVKDNGDGTVTLYMISSVLSTNFKNAGFNIKFNGNAVSGDYTTTAAYTKIDDFLPEGANNYLVMAAVKINLANKNDTDTLTVESYLTLNVVWGGSSVEGGNTVEGETVTLTIAEIKEMIATED